MAFYQEPEHYKKTAVSDLQGAWMNFRDAVVEAPSFSEYERLLFHIDEGMSWESVRNLDSMNNTLLLIQNIVARSEVPGEILDWVEHVKENLEEVFKAIKEGDIH
jgi:hypothetical protein